MQEQIEQNKVIFAIKTGRMFLGLSQVEFAKCLGMSKAAYARIESGDKELPYNLISFIFNSFNDLGIIVDLGFRKELSISFTNEAMEKYTIRMDDLAKADGNDTHDNVKQEIISKLNSWL